MAVFVLVVAVQQARLCAAEAAEEQVVESVDVGTAWAGHPVGFALLTHSSDQFVAFYDGERRLAVAQRRIPSQHWKITRLSEQLGWDSHNTITMTLDDQDYIHLCANMHAAPLVYFRSTKPLDAASLERVSKMVGPQEDRMTYPTFLRGPSGELIFAYRDGQSGDGEQIYNVYNTSTRTWRRLLDKPLTSGEGERNAYIFGPRRGPDGYFHIAWVWREDPDCSTNHSLCYARSKDLVHWETSRGKPMELPITRQSAEVVDPVPVHGGIINGNHRIGFDSKNRVVISYHKYDANGNTQAYNARLEGDRWRIYQTSDWNYRWDFKGGGTIDFAIVLGAVQSAAGKLTQSFTHSKAGSGTWLLNEDSLTPTAILPPARQPAELATPESSFEGIRVNVANDTGSAQPGERYVLRWESLGPNRDHARENYPPPGPLRVLKLSRTTPSKAPGS